MDVPGQEAIRDDHDRVRPPKRDNDERKIGQEKIYISKIK